ncbi:MAG: RNA methyltransferase [Rhodospirillales bacterium]|nr:RNA methyltransferase [Rhodospirillales bacterium]
MPSIGSSTAMAPEAPPVVVLIRPQLGENIGAAARAMMNCGLERLRLVAPRDGWPNRAAWPMAAGAGEILERAELFESLQAAVADLRRLYATTARKRDLAKWIATPRQAAAELRALAARGGQSGLLFGPERSGIASDELALADVLVTVPLNPRHASLNLAQAVLLLGYEWWQAADATAPLGLHRGNSAPAGRGQLADFLDRLETALEEDGFFRTPEQKPHMLRNLKTLFLRADPSDQEIRTLHGLIAALRGRRRNRPRPKADVAAGNAKD